MTNGVTTQVVQISLLSLTREVMATFDVGQRMVISPVRGFSGEPKAIREIRISHGSKVVRVNFRPDSTIAVARLTDLTLDQVGEYIRAVQAYADTLAPPENHERRERQYVSDTLAKLAELTAKQGW